MQKRAVALPLLLASGTFILGRITSVEFFSATLILFVSA